MSHKTEEIWENFCCRIKSFIRKRVSNASAAEDIFQDVFLKIHSKIDTLKDDTKIRSWVYQIAQNTIIDYYRKHKTDSLDIESLLVNEQEEFEMSRNRPMAGIEISEASEISEEEKIASGLKEIAESLPEKYAQAILLVEFEGLSQTEFARILGISVSGAKSRVQRGRQLIKDALMRCCHFEFDKYGTIIDSRPVTCCCCN
ncbi:MAG TPA: RNA polymerase sigma factor SigZ [Ignavibacteriaceae bacterium]|nr:RNA polymerase sigma factor SigZ [Ignavibacteriaceae bacterium]